MMIIEVEELPKKITWIGCVREPIYDGHRSIVGMYERGMHRAYVKRGFKVSAQDLMYMDASD